MRDLEADKRTLAELLEGSVPNTELAPFCIKALPWYIGEVERLRNALASLPYYAFREAMSDGVDACGAWECFVEECAEHVEQALNGGGE